MNRILISVTESEYQMAMVIAARMTARQAGGWTAAPIKPETVIAMAAALGLPQLGRQATPEREAA